MIIQVQNKFCPLGTAIWEVDGGIFVNGQLDCSLWENQDVGNVVGSVGVYALPSERDWGFILSVWSRGEEEFYEIIKDIKRNR